MQDAPAGTAAALSLQAACPPRELDVKVLQDALRAAGAIFDAPGIEAANQD